MGKEEQDQRAVEDMEAAWQMEVGMEVEANEEVHVEAVEMGVVGMEAVDTEATQEGASASRASMEAEAQKKLYHFHRRPPMGQLVPVVIATDQAAITGVGIRNETRTGLSTMQGETGGRGTTVDN